jgi:hypothetical protein
MTAVEAEAESVTAEQAIIPPTPPVVTKEDFERARWSRASGLLLMLLFVLLGAWALALWRAGPAEADKLLDLVKIVVFASVGLAGGIAAVNKL